MPNYEIEHICPLTEGQKDEIAEAITKIHTSQFTAPRLFVNCRFTDIDRHAVYVAGKRVSTLSYHLVRLIVSCTMSYCFNVSRRDDNNHLSSSFYLRDMAILFVVSHHDSIDLTAYLPTSATDQVVHKQTTKP